MKNLIYMAWLCLCGTVGFCDKTKFVIVIPSYNNEKWAERNIQSALNQKYSDFRVMYINDASTDATLMVVNRVKEEYDLFNRLTIYSNSINRGAVYNFYHYIHAYVEDEEVVVSLDGDDRLAHDGVLSTLDQAYASGSIWLTYGSYLRDSGPSARHCKPLPFLRECSPCYRNIPFVASHLRTFKGWLFKKIRKEDLLYEGEFFKITYDLALMYPMLEMASNRHFTFIRDNLYLYNDENELNDHKKAPEMQLKMDRYIRGLSPYAPL